MSLWLRLNANEHAVGFLEVQRVEPLLPPAKMTDDTVGRYVVRVDGQDRAEVRHRYGDGAWQLLRRALAAAFPSDAERDLDALVDGTTP